jgi:hypothetical protein
MKKDGKFILFSLDEFDQWLKETRFNRVITLIQNHHTYIPGYSHFTGTNHFPLLKSMERSHIERGFDQIAQNLTTFPDGSVAVCRPFERIPAGIKGANTPGLCIENIGNFDNGGDAMNDGHRNAIVRTNALLCREFNLTPSTDSIVYHHWYDLTTGTRTNGGGNTKSCPGTAFFGGNSVAMAAAGFIPLVNAMLGNLGAPAIAATQGMYQAEVIATSLNVRSSSNGAASIVKALKQGIIVSVYEEANGWCRIHPTEQHWISGKFLRTV